MTKRLSRRTFLRGTGVAIGLPLLESMQRRSLFGSEDVGLTPPRICFLYVANGVNSAQWVPTTHGPDYELSPTLKTLEENRQHFSVLSGLCHPQAKGGHSGADSWLTGVDLAGTPGFAYRNVMSFDQVLASHLGQQTRFPSLELSTLGGTGAAGHSHTLAFNREGIPLPAENSCRRLFQRLFAEPASRSLTKQRQEFDQRSSILDAIQSQAASLNKRLGTTDKRKLDEYLTSVREVERRLERAEAWMNVKRPKIDDDSLRLDADPATLGDSHTYFETMFELIRLAFQTDSSRVCTFQLSREAHGGFLDELGLSADHHELSHHGGDATMLAELQRVDEFYLRQFQFFLNRLSTRDETDDSLMDRTLIVYGSGMNNGYGGGHSPKNLPLLLAGGRSLGVTHNRHLAYDDGVPMCNLFQTIQEAAGLQADHFQDASGTLRGFA
ncbi:MAG: DUF1552 domain-containing protein [Planctomycetales bacterium]|nr:DUF1552 domain-containing protein [Planctomycetales bacterium]